MSLFKNYHYIQQLHKYTSCFGELFNGIIIKRYDVNTNRQETIKVPIRYGAGNAYEKLGEVSLDKRIRQILPVISFNIASINEDEERKTQPYTKLSSNTVIYNQKNSSYNRMPYDIGYDLNIRTKSMDDMLQLIEQIITVFSPQVSIQLIDSQELNIENQNIVVKLLSSIPFSIMDNYEESLENSRILEVTLQFILKGFLYKPVITEPVVMDIQLLTKFSCSDFADSYIVMEVDTTGC